MSAELLSSLASVLPADRIASDPESLLVYGYDGASGVTGRPDVVVSVQEEAEIVATLRVAESLRVPVFPRGAATGLAGGSVPSCGIVLNLAPMCRIIEIDTANLMATVEPGVINADLQAAVEAVGLFYPPDPASLKQSTIGGNVATGAGGPRCLKYGTTREYVRGIRAVLPGGQVVEDGGKYLKCATGYNLSQLFVGSEGTLGAISRITLRLLPRPPAVGSVVALFASLDSAAAMVERLLADGILPCVMEFMDRLCIECVEKAYHLGLAPEAEALVLIEADGTPEAVESECRRIAQICEEGGAFNVRRASDAGTRADLWRARRAVSPSLSRLRPARLGEDISLPRASIVSIVAEIRRIAAKHNLLIPVFGHIGDGNLHPNILYDPRDPEETRRVHIAAEELIRAAVAAGGTLSGEHGIGIAKRDLLPLALPELNQSLCKQIKQVFDPHNLMNPGKIFP